jgi:hypothetical protein
MVAIAGVSCGTMPATFFEMLASCIKKNTDGEIFLNVVCYTNSDCNDLSEVIECGEGISDPEAFVVANAFTTDACGNPALKLRICTTEEVNPT